MYPNLKFEYVFNCDKHATKRKFVHAMHEHLAEQLGQSHLPCMFEDITDIPKGTQRCSCHTEIYHKRNVGKNCPIVGFHIFFCSSSCKDLSVQNSKRAKGNCLAPDSNATPGGSKETFWALTDIMGEWRPDIVFFENVTQLDKEDEEGTSNLDIIIEAWAKRGYASHVYYVDTYEFGLPQHRVRIVIVALNTRDPKLLDFSERSTKTVFATLGALLKLCTRTPECATKYLLDDTSTWVTEELGRAQAEAVSRTDKGFNVSKQVEICDTHNIPSVSYTHLTLPTILRV